MNTHCVKAEHWGFYEIYSRKPFGVKRYHYLYLFYSYGSVQSNSTEPSSYMFKKKSCNFSVARLQKRTYGRMLAITCAFFVLIACSVQNPCYLIDNASRGCLHDWGQTWKKRQFLHFNYCLEETVNYYW